MKKEIILLGFLVILFTGQLFSQSIMRLGYSLTDIAYNPVNDKIYGVYSGQFKDGNVLLIINPDSGIIEDTIPIRSEPSALRFSSNYQYLYIGFKDWYGMQKYTLSTGKVEDVKVFSEIQRTSANRAIQSLYNIIDLIPIPGQPDNLIVDLGNLLVLNNGSGLPDSITDYVQQSNNISFHKETSTVYGFGNDHRTTGLLKYSLTSSGIVFDSTYPYLSGETMELEIVRNKLYCQTGEVFDITGSDPVPVGNIYSNTGRNYYAGVMEFDTLTDFIYLLDWLSSPYGYYLYTINPDDLSLVSKVNLWSTSAIHLKKLISLGKPGRLALLGSPTLNTNLEIWPANLFLINQCGSATPENISITSSNGNSVCKGDSITLTASGQHDQFVWNNGMRGAQISFPLAVTTTISVSGFDDQGCITGKSALFPVTVFKPASLKGNDVQYAICKGDSVTLNVSSDDATYYIWSTGQQAPTIIVHEPGYYKVLGYTGPGCTDGVAQGRLVEWHDEEDIPKPVVIPPGPVQICPDEILDISTQPGDLYCEWKHNDNPSSHLSVMSAGSYQVRFKDGFGCFGPYSDPLIVSIATPPNIPTLRVNDSLVYIFQNTVEVEWFFNGQQIQRPPHDSLVATDYGFYAIRVISPDGCHSKMGGAIAMIKPKLSNPGDLQFYVFADYNANNILDGDDFILNDQAILFQSHYFKTYTGTGGIGKISLPSGAYDLVAQIDTSIWKLQLGKDGIHINLTTSGATAVFSLIPKSEKEKIVLSITNSRFRCSREADVRLIVKNQGAHFVSGHLCSDIDDAIVAISDNGHNIQPVPDQLCWEIDSLKPSGSWFHTYRITLPGVENVGDSIRLNSYMETDTGYWEMQRNVVIRCSYDPNDKSVLPSLGDMGKYAWRDQPLEYTIRFQNTGNDTAFQVTLVDYLSEDLNWETFEPVGASHNYNVILNMLSGKLTVQFINIMLPDTNTNRSGSEGYFVFHIMPKAGLEEHDIISNTANIYFDLNPAIVTNTVTCELVTEIPVSVQNEYKNDELFSFFPNPYHEGFMFNMNAPAVSVNLEIFDVLGQKWLDSIFISDNFPAWVNAKQWPQGVFFYKVYDEKKLHLISNGVMIRE